MHNLYIVFNKYEDSEEISDNLTEQGFHNQWFFSNWKADWFVIWWRWSWILSELQWIDVEKRDNYKSYWYEDDHQLITEDLFDKLKDKYSDIECLLYCNDPNHPNDSYIEKEELLSDITFNEIEWMYITIIDYHF
jgi:hypothetical protein